MWPDDPDLHGARECLENLIAASRPPVRIVELHEAVRAFGRCARRSRVAPNAVLRYVRALLARRTGPMRDSTGSDSVLVSLLTSSYYEP